MPGRLRRRALAAALAVGLSLALTAGGCTFGPRVLERTYGPYYESVRHAEEEEFLRNLVHIRYNETAGLLNVSSIAAQYELSGHAEARPFFEAPNPSGTVFRTFTAILPDVFVEGANRPTVSFVPGDDSEAVRRFLTPITTENLIFFIQAGWPVSTVLRLWAAGLNGVPNTPASPADAPPCDGVPGVDRFQRVMDLLQAAAERELLSTRAEERVTEVSGPLPEEAVTAAAAVEAAKNDLEFRRNPDGKSWALVRRERRPVVGVTPGAEGSPELVELEGLLNLVPGQSRYEFVVAPGRVPDPLLHPRPPSAELRVTPRSTAQVYQYLANGVQVPPEHVAAGLVCPAADAEGHVPEGREATGGLFAVASAAGHKPPADAYVAVKYRGYWYYLDDRDTRSKATFAMMLHASQLDFRRRPPGGGPLLTLPAGR